MKKEFNAGKCELLHSGKSNQDRTYTVNGRSLGNVVVQRDLAVQVHRSLKVMSQVDGVERLNKLGLHSRGTRDNLISILLRGTRA